MQKADDQPTSRLVEAKRTSFSRSERTSVLVALALIVLPAVLFYTILFRNAVDIPIQDDYEGLLDFLNRVSTLQGVGAKTSYFLAAQYNEYKLFFVHGFSWLTLRLTGHINIKLICAIGNTVILLLAILLWKNFLPKHPRLSYRLTFFIPASWLLFQLQYVETLNWAMASLANLPVLLFSLGGIYLLVNDSRAEFLGAAVCLVLAVSSIGSGLLMIPIGLLILVSERRYKRLLAWSLVSLACVVSYAYRYNTMSSQSRLNHSVLSTVVRARPLYVVAFMGNAAAFPLGGRYLPFEVSLSILVGLALCAFFIVLLRRGYARTNPVVCYWVLFLTLTAVGVAGLRSDISVAQSMDSRYAIYSALFLILAWFAIVEEFLQYERVAPWRNTTLPVAVFGAMLFAITMDLIGARYLAIRNQEIILGMTAYEHSAKSGKVRGPILGFQNQNARFNEMDRHAPLILKQSTQLGIYSPPIY